MKCLNERTSDEKTQTNKIVHDVSLVHEVTIVMFELLLHAIELFQAYFIFNSKLV